MEQMIKERGEKINSADLYYVTMEIKEKYGFLTFYALIFSHYG